MVPKYMLIHFYSFVCTHCHPQTVTFYHDSFVWLDHRNASSLDQNPAYFTFSRTPYSRSIVILYVSEGIFKYIILLMRYRLSPYLRRAIAFQQMWQPTHFPTRILNPQGVYIYIYIVIHRQTASLYLNSSVWLLWVK